MPAVVGRYTVEKRAIVFKSEYGFDAGRRYVVTFDASKLPAASDAWQPAPLTSIVGLPARNLVPTTVVSGVFPSAQIVSGEERWQFVPAEPWRSGEHRLIVLTFLEDMRAAVSAAPSKSMSFRMWTNRRKRKP